MTAPEIYRTRIKICGITRMQDALAAVQAGADALGFVFYPPSPRHIELHDAQNIISRLPAFVTPVGLFVNADADSIQQALAAGIELIQFHGNECPDYCASFGKRWIKAIRVREDTDLLAESARYAAGAGLLLDAYRPGVPGGTGECFDWDKIPEALAPDIILAGGLNPDNITDAVRRVRPYGVDVSGGVEAEKGIKDPEKIQRFIRGVALGQQ